MGEGLDIPAADLLFVTFQAEGIIYLALLKMNYKESYTHEITEIRKTFLSAVPVFLQKRS